MKNESKFEDKKLTNSLFVSLIKNNPEWIKEKITNECIEFADNLGFYLVDKGEFLDDKKNYLSKKSGRNAVTNSQIRNVFGEVKRIQMRIQGNSAVWDTEKTNFFLIKPKIAYAQARVISKSKSSRITVFKEVLDLAHSLVGTPKDFQNFANLLEAILAYHKSYGGKE